MTATLPVDLLLGFLLAVVRTAAWLVVAPPFNTRMVPVTAKVGLAVALAVPVAPRIAATVRRSTSSAKATARSAPPRWSMPCANRIRR